METICIVCPKGCRLRVHTSRGRLSVGGNACPRGEAYGLSEATDPRRVVTAVVRTDSAAHPCVPVKTAVPVPKTIIPRLLSHLYSLVVGLPVGRGAMLLERFEGTEVRVVFTRGLSPAEEGERR
jgi:CxxC motif-containing protein